MMKKLLILLWCMSACVMSYGQTLKTYSGPYSKGKATYTYYENADEERIYHGKFAYTEYDYKTVKMKVTGAYKDNLRHGEWIFTFYKRSISKVKNIPPTITSVVKINYKDGKLDGKILSYDKGTKLDKDHCFTLKDNHFVGHLVNNSEKISGNFDEDGHPIGDFIYKDEYITIKQTFWRGVLVSEMEKNETTGDIERKKYEVSRQSVDVLIANYDSVKNISVVDGDKYELKKCYGGIFTAFWGHGNGHSIPEAFSKIAFDIINDCKVEGYGVPERGVVSISSNVLFNLREFENAGKYVKPEEVVYDYNLVEEKPEFPGGKQAMLTYLTQDGKLHGIAESYNVSGRTIASCIVETDGSISDVKIVRGFLSEVDRELVQRIKSMPKWKPGKQGGKPVRVRVLIPINIRFQ